MSKMKLALITIGCCAVLMSTALATSVKMKLSGPGKVNDSTIKAGQKVDLDIYLTNDSTHLGISIGFKLTSPDNSIKTVIHPVDSGKGLNGFNGDIKGFGPYADRTIFDLLNQVVPTDWDGKLPDLMGILTCGFKKSWEPMPETKAYSIELIVPDAGILKVDSAFFPPGGTWLVTKKNAAAAAPAWGGPYKFKVVK